MRQFLPVILAVCFLLPRGARAQFVERSTDVLCLLPTATAAVLTLVNKDEKGFKQFALSTLTFPMAWRLASGSHVRTATACTPCPAPTR